MWKVSQDTRPLKDYSLSEGCRELLIDGNISFPGILKILSIFGSRNVCDLDVAMFPDSLASV